MVAVLTPTRLRAPGVLLAGAALLAAWLWSPLWSLVGVVALLLTVAVLRFPLVGFVLLAFAVPWASSLTIPAGAFSFTPTDVVVALLTGVWLTRAAYRHQNPLRGAWWPFVVLFLAVIVLSATQATDRGASIREIVKWVELAGLYGAAVFMIRTERAVMTVVAAIVLAGLSQALLGYVQEALQAGPASFIVSSGFLRAYGTFDQPNPFAGYLNMTLPPALAMGLLLPASPARFWYRVAAVLIGGGVLASASRGAFIAGVGAAVVVAVLARPRLRPALWLAILAGLLVTWAATFGLVPAGPVDRVLNAMGLGNVSFTSVNNANFSAVERAAHWLAGVRMFAAHPLLGVGIGNYAAAYPAFHPRGWYNPLEHAHNYYINIAAEAGIAGLTTYVLLAGSALWYSYAALRQASNRVRAAAIVGTIGVLVATDIHNLVDVLYVHGMVALLGLLVALAVTPAMTQGPAPGEYMEKR